MTYFIHRIGEKIHVNCLPLRTQCQYSGAEILTWIPTPYRENKTSGSAPCSGKTDRMLTMHSVLIIPVTCLVYDSTHRIIFTHCITVYLYTLYYCVSLHIVLLCIFTYCITVYLYTLYYCVSLHIVLLCIFTHCITVYLYTLYYCVSLHIVLLCIFTHCITVNVFFSTLRGIPGWVQKFT